MVAGVGTLVNNRLFGFGRRRREPGRQQAGGTCDIVRPGSGGDSGFPVHKATSGRQDHLGFKPPHRELSIAVHWYTDTPLNQRPPQELVSHHVIRTTFRGFTRPTVDPFATPKPEELDNSAHSFSSCDRECHTAEQADQALPRGLQDRGQGMPRLLSAGSSRQMSTDRHLRVPHTRAPRSRAQCAP